MNGGTLVVSKAKMLYPQLNNFLLCKGYFKMTFTGLGRDALISKIRELKPKLLLIDSDYCQAATPFIVGQIHHKFPKLNIAAVAANNFPLTISAWFIWYGAKSCLHLWADGWKEFSHGLEEVKNGKAYISPVIQSILDLFPDWPKTRNNVTNRQFATLILLCCGLGAVEIADEMNLSRKTIDNTFGCLFEAFQVHKQEELISFAWSSGLVNKNDLRFYRKDKYLKFPEWAVVKQKTNEKLQEIYRRVYGDMA